jgi:hypothetical protein
MERSLRYLSFFQERAFKPPRSCKALYHRQIMPFFKALQNSLLRILKTARKPLSRSGLQDCRGLEAGSWKNEKGYESV